MTPDVATLTRQLDQSMAHVFIGKAAAFLGSLMCTLEFKWDDTQPTAYVNNEIMGFNPDFFTQLPVETRETVLVHELWHLGRLHILRLGDRDPKIWNYACDIRINNDLEKDGYSFVGVEDCWKDQSFGDMPEEDIYDKLMKQQFQPPGSTWNKHGTGSGDIEDAAGTKVSQSQAQAAVNAVVRAIQQAQLHNQAGTIPGNVQEFIKTFLSPVIPWRNVLQKFFTESLNEDYSWKRPNRRHHDIYLPTRISENGRLQHLMYFLDVSGSISTQDIIRFNSEVKHVKDTYQPEKMTLVQFDTKIQKVDVIKEYEPFDVLEVIGRGGTSLIPVREMINEQKPTAAIIFSDLYCEPMDHPLHRVPIIWAVINNPHAKPLFGRIIHVKD